ncbi:phosphotransferase [Streptomyces nogalater]
MLGHPWLFSLKHRARIKACSGTARPTRLALPLGKLERHLNGARPHLAPGDEEFIRATARRAAALPAPEEVVPTHGDLQLRNLRWDATTDTLYVIGFERSEDGPAVRDLSGSPTPGSGAPISWKP